MKNLRLSWKGLLAIWVGGILGLSGGWTDSTANARENQHSKPAEVKGSYQIRNVEFGDLLRPRGANSEDGTPIVLYPRQDWKCLTWKCEPSLEKGYRLINHFTLKTFIPDPEAKGATLPLIQVSNGEKTKTESWQFFEIEKGVYRIVHVGTGKVLTAVEGGRKVVLAADEGRDSQRWQLLPRPKKFSA